MELASTCDLKALVELLNPDDESCEINLLCPPSSQPVSKANPHVPIKPKISLVKDEAPVWNEQEISSAATIKEVKDNKVTPKYDVLLQQKVGTEDVFLGLGGKTPSSDYCDNIIVKVYMPETTFKQVTVEVFRNRILVLAPKYRLDLPLSDPIERKQSDAKWVTEGCCLILKLPIAKKIEYIQI